MENKSIQERFDHLLKFISSERFLKKQGLNNEVPFFICPFEPAETVEMARIKQQLINQLGSRSIQVLDINLYDLAIEILKEL